LHKGLVSSDVGLMVLVHKRFNGVARKSVHVFTDWVSRPHIILYWDKFVGVLDTQNLDHLAMKLWEVVDLWGGLRHLQHCLVLDHSLGHRAAIRITDRNNFHHSVVGSTSTRFATVRHVHILFRGVLSDDFSQEFEFLLPSSNGREIAPQPLVLEYVLVEQVLFQQVR
jgi:hypothetical protein